MGEGESTDRATTNQSSKKNGYTTTMRGNQSGGELRIKGEITSGEEWP